MIVTPSGPTRCRLAPIPKGVKLSVPTTRIPVPQKPFTFDMPKNTVINGARAPTSQCRILTNSGIDSERRPLNRTKRNHQGTHSSQNTSHSSPRVTAAFHSGFSLAQQITSPVTRGQDPLLLKHQDQFLPGEIMYVPPSSILLGLSSPNHITVIRQGILETPRDYPT